MKPLFRDVQVGDPRAEPRKGVARRVVGGVAGLLENKARDEVATQTDLSRPLGNPETGTFELLAKLVQSAFIQSILPGFDLVGDWPAEPFGLRAVGTEFAPEASRSLPMLSSAVMLFVVALVAGLLGFAGIADAATGIAKILFFVLLVPFAISLAAERRLVEP